MAEVSTSRSELGLQDSKSNNNDQTAAAVVVVAAVVSENGEVSTLDGGDTREHGAAADGRLACDRQTSANGESVPISVDFVPLTSPEAAETLYRVDEAAYTAACGRTHMLHTKKRKRQLGASNNPDYLAMAQHGSAMKLQRRNILARLYKMEKRREAILSELWAAMDKIESRASRAEAASVAWGEYCSAKGKQWSLLDGVLSSLSGRRIWEEYLKSKLVVMEGQGKSQKADAAPCRRPSPPGRSIGEGLFLEGEEARSLNTTQTVDETSLSSEVAVFSSDQEREGSPLSVLGEEEDGNLVSESKLTGSGELSSLGGATAGVGAIVAEGREKAAMETDSPVSIGQLHVALEGLIKPVGQDARGKGGSCLNTKRCAAFSKEWMGGSLPTFLDPSLLQAVWSAVDQGSSGRRVRVEELSAARESVRLEAQRLFFPGFLDSSDGQDFILNALQDGTLGPAEAQGFVTHLTESAHYDEDAQGFRRLIAHGDHWMHSRLVHEGVEQRIRVEAAEPLLRAMLEEVDSCIFDDRGELAVVVQHVYHLAALTAQPAIRGALARIKLPARRQDTLSHAFLCAAAEIQRVFRGVLGRNRVQQHRIPLLSASFAPLQARIRGFLVRQRVARKWSELFNLQAVEIQRVYRGHRGRGTAHTTLNEETWAQNVDLHGWASSVIQRHSRVWLARQVVRLKRVEVGLTSRVSELAERLATAEDSRSVSTVLSEVDRDYRAYENRIRNMQAKESTMAATFVEKVLERRDAEIAGAWNSFVGAAIGHTATLKRRSDARRAHPTLARGTTTDGVGGGSHHRKFLRLMERYVTPAAASTLPSAYLRAALPAHIDLRGGGFESAIISDPAAEATKVYTTALMPKRRRINNGHLDSDLTEPFLTRTNGEASASAGGGSSSNSRSSCWTGSYLDASLSTPAEATTTPTTASTAASHARSSPNEGKRKVGSAACGGGKQKSSHVSGGGGESDGGGGGGGGGCGGSGGGVGGGNGAIVRHKKRVHPHTTGRAEEQRTAGRQGTSTPDGRELIALSDTATPLSAPGSNSDCHSHPGEAPPRVVGSSGRNPVGEHDGSISNGGTDEPGPVFAGSREHGGIEWERGWDCERESRGLTGDGQSRFPGSSVRQAMPSGLEDVVERFCAAAFLRGHVPQGLMPADTPPEEAYQRYLELPPSLAKIRHEQLCREASRAVASVLRSRGFLVVQQLLPISKLEHVFGQAGAGAGETSAAVSLARELKSRSAKSSSRGGTGHTFPPLSAFSRRALEGGTPFDGLRGKGGEGEPTGRGAGGDSRGGGRAGAGGRGGDGYTSPKGQGNKISKKKKGPLRICLTGVRLEGGAGEGEEGDGRWDPRRYTSRPDEWLRPPCSRINRRWDDKNKAFVGANTTYSFDRLYRRHHPLHPSCDDRNSDGSQTVVKDDNSRDEREQDDEEGAKRSAGGNGLPHHTTPCARPNVRERYSRRVADIMREEYDAFFDGMTPTAHELYQYIFNDTESWGTVENPISTLLRRAAFYVVEHPSPATRAEIATARARDCRAKGFRGNENRLARPIALAAKFPPGKFEQELKEAAMAGQHVAMGPEALRCFVEQLDAVGTGRPFSSSSELESPRNGESNMPQVGGDGKHVCPVTGRFGFTLADPRRTLMERRLEAAETLAGPFALRLEADGVYNVKVLARVPVRAWDLPPCLVEQVERMIGLLAARTCATDHYQAHHRSGGNMKSRSSSKPASSVVRGGRGGGHLRAKKRVGVIGVSGDGKRSGKRGGGGCVCRQQQAQHMLAFDPRFQRSAVDPFGRPPRLERVQTGPDPGQHRVKGGDCHRDGGDRGLLEVEEYDDLAPGPWDRPPVAEGRAGRDETGDHIPEKAEKDKIAFDHSTAVGATATTSLFPFEETSPGPPSSSLPPTTSTTVEPEDTQHELYRKLAAAAHPEQPNFGIERRKPLGQPRPRRRQSRQRGGGGGLRRKQPLTASNRNRDPPTNATSKKDGNQSTRPEALELNTRRRLTCRVPHCSAVFTSISTLRTHEKSHAAAPEYHRLRRAPQLFRDPPPAPSEDEGADAARFHLRTTLPAGVRRELQQLQEESAHRRRGSLLSLPGLAGAAATWAGVVGPGRKVGESV